VVTGVSSGSTTISYNVTNSCGTSVATKYITVNPLPVSGTLSCGSSVCAGSTIWLSTSSWGGVWSSSNTSVATVSTSGGVTGVSSGSVVISYSVTNSCGTSVVTRAVTVNPLPVSGTITGSHTACAGTSVMLSDTSYGGIWNSSNTSRASVSSSGIVSVLTSGSVVISYSVSNSCGSSTATFPLTINGTPAVSSITGASSLNIGLTTTFSDLTSGGTWSSANPAIATVSTGGLVTGISVGAATISYSVSNSCGTTRVSKGIVILPVFLGARADTPGVDLSSSLNSSIKVYPNPGISVFYMALPPFKTGFTVSVFDLKGQEILRHSYTQEEIEISVDLQDRPAGNYILKISSDQGIYTERIILLDH